MLRQTQRNFQVWRKQICNLKQIRPISFDGNQNNREGALRSELDLTGVHLDEIDSIMTEQIIQPHDEFYPKQDIEYTKSKRPHEGHNLSVIQPWVSYANFDQFTDPDLQLSECVSLGNTIHNWQVVEKRIVFAKQLHRKHLLGSGSFETLKESILSNPSVTATFFGVELLSAIQLKTLESELMMPVFDRFTMVLNIFREHARTKEARLQLALAELPYIRSHLREIHESSEYSSAAESLKTLVGGVGEKLYFQRMDILKKREARLRSLLNQVRVQRDVNKKKRRIENVPTVSVVGYTNSGKTSLIKYLTHDERLIPKDQLFATLDVSVHRGQLPSTKDVLYLDTVGFLSRIPFLLVEAFATTLKDVQESDLIVHILDVSHPDHKLQHSTVIKALQSLKIPKNLLETRLTIGNKADLIDPEKPKNDLPKCDVNISVTAVENLDVLVDKISDQLTKNLKHEVSVLRVENGGKQYAWLRKNATIIECKPDETDGNYLVCRVIMSQASAGRWTKMFGV